MVRSDGTHVWGRRPRHPLAASAGFPSAVTLDSTSRSELPLISYVPSPVLGKQILIT